MKKTFSNSLILLMFCCVFAVNCEEMPKQSIYALVGYNNEFGEGVGEKHIKGVNLGASYERYLIGGLKIAPELRFGYNWQSEGNDIIMSMRGIFAYKIPRIEKMAVKLPLTIFTGPVADLYLRHEYEEYWYGIPYPEFVGNSSSVREKASHNGCTVSWYFGLGFDIKMFSVRGSVSLPISATPDNLYSPDKYHSFEVTLGYRFSLK